MHDWGRCPQPPGAIPRIARTGAAPGRAHAVSQRETGKCALRDSLSRSSFAFSSGGCPKRPPLAFRGASPSARTSTPEQREKRQGGKRSGPCVFRARRHRTSATDGREKGRGKGAVPLPLPFVVKLRGGCCTRLLRLGRICGNRLRRTGFPLSRRPLRAPEMP